MLQCQTSGEALTESDGSHTDYQQPSPPSQQSESLPLIPDSFPQVLLPQNPFSSDKLHYPVDCNAEFVSQHLEDNSPGCLLPAEGMNDNQCKVDCFSPTSECSPASPDKASGVGHQESDVFERNPGVDNGGDVQQSKADGEDRMQSDSSTDGDDQEGGPAESKAFGSDSCSDVCMDSNSTVTLESSGSDTCLLKEDSCSDDNLLRDDPVPNTGSADDTPTSYTNQVFSMEGSKTPVTSSLEEEKNMDVNANDSDLAEDSMQSGASLQSQDRQLLTDKEGETEDGENAPLQKDTALENFVCQLAENHPGEMVSITVNELDTPENEIKAESLHVLNNTASESLRVPYQGAASSLLHSTESLHAYKLSKRGYPGNNLHVHAINNCRARTMDNIHLRSSFRNLASISVSNLGQVCQKALGYLRTDMEFCSMMSIGKGEKQPSMLTVDEGEFSSDEESSGNDASQKGGPSVPSGRHMRNLLYMSLLITIFFVASYATRNLQSSLNQDGAVGIICLAVFFGFYILGSLLSPVMVQGLGVIRCIIGGLVCQLFYVGVNLYPVMWLMVPASVGGGASLALIWNAMSTYLVMLARGESHVTEIPYERLSDKYFGIFCLIYQSNLIVGNLISALVLSYGDSPGDSSAAPPVPGIIHNSTVANHTLFNSENASHTAITELTIFNGSSYAFDISGRSDYDICGADFCHHYEISKGGSSVSQLTKFVLFGIFMLMIVICMFIGLCLLEPLCPHLFPSTASPWQRVRKQVVSLAKFSLNRKFLLFVPLMLYSVMQYCFVSSEVTVAFMTCPIGVWMVGYSMMSYGANCSIGSYVCQALSPRVGQGFFVAVAYAINIGLLLCMRFWKPDSDSLVPVLIIASLFGFADGIWNVVANGICGSVFPNHFEEAFTGLRVAQGIGGSFNMAYSPFFCLTVKIYVMMGVVTVVFLGYVGARILIKLEDRAKEAALYEKEIAAEQDC